MGRIPVPPTRGNPVLLYYRGIALKETHDVTKISLFLRFWNAHSDISDICYLRRWPIIAALLICIKLLFSVVQFNTFLS